MLFTSYLSRYRSVYEKVRVNSTEIWKFEMFCLVMEYKDKPCLAPPLNILELAWLAGKAAWKTYGGRREKTSERRQENCN